MGALDLFEARIPGRDVIHRESRERVHHGEPDDEVADVAVERT